MTTAMVTCPNGHRNRANQHFCSECGAPLVDIVELFACQHCSAVPELIGHGKAKVSVVRHALACPVLIAQTKTRWPLAQDALPYTPGALST